MCAAALSKYGQLYTIMPRSPTKLMRTKMQTLLQQLGESIKRSSGEHTQFKIVHQIKEEEAFFRTNNSIITYAKMPEEPVEEKGVNHPLYPTCVAKIFRAHHFRNKKTQCLESDRFDRFGIDELSILTYFAQEKVPHVPPVLAASWDPESQECVLIFPYLGRNVESKLISMHVPLQIEELSKMSICVLSALRHIQKMAPNAKHCDIKPSNITYKNGDYTLIDWGSFVIGRSTAIENLMTPVIRPPEVILRIGNYGAEVDVWSFGVTLFMTATCQNFSPNLNHEDELGHLHAICNRTKSRIPRELQRLSPLQAKFFKKNGQLVGSHQRLEPCSKSLEKMKKSLIAHLPAKDPNRKSIDEYYKRLTQFIVSILIIDPNLRPNNHDGLLQHFCDSGLCI